MGLYAVALAESSKFRQMFMCHCVKARVIFSLFFFEGEEKKNLKFVFKNNLWQVK